MSVMTTHVARLGMGTTIAAMCLAAVSAQLPADAPTRVALYAGVGEELITFGVDVERATLTRESSLMLPGFVQEAWASPRGTFLYVAWSNGGASYAGSGVEPRGDRHGITAFRVDAGGALRQQGPPAPLRSRPIHITGDGPGRYLLVAYNDPSGVSVHTINADGGVGAEVPQRASLDAGVYAHQVRVLPSNRAVVLVTRGNEPTASSREDPGALKVFHYDAGKLSDEISIAPQNGLGFRARHLDFHPTRPWVFLTIEAQNRLQMYRRTRRGAGAHAVVQRKHAVRRKWCPTGADGQHGPRASEWAVRVRRQSRRADRRTQRDRCLQDQRGDRRALAHPECRHTRLHAADVRVDPSGRLLVVGNQNSVPVGEGGSTKLVPANLAVFRIGSNETLTFAQSYDVAVARKPLWWMESSRLADDRPVLLREEFLTFEPAGG